MQEVRSKKTYLTSVHTHLTPATETSGAGLGPAIEIRDMTAIPLGKAISKDCRPPRIVGALNDTCSVMLRAKIMSTTMPSLGTNLRRLREARGISQRILAQKIGVSMPTVSMWESDQRRPVLKRLNQICEILGVSAGELMTGAKSAELAGLLAQSREQIARFLGTSPDKVRIMIEI